MGIFVLWISYLSSALQKTEGKNQAQKASGLNLSKNKYLNSGYLQNWQFSFLNYLFCL